jgi:hypothetical protein
MGLTTQNFMSNLLAIETAFLSNTQVKTAMQLTEINKLKTADRNAQKKKFETSCALSKLVSQAHDWFFIGEGKEIALREGIAWNKEEFGMKVFGWQKSYLYKLLKVSKIEADTITRFTNECDRLESEQKKTDRSVEGLLKFAKAVEGGEGGGEGGEGGEGGDIAPSVERAPVVFVFTYKSDSGNVSVRVDANGGVKTSNTAEQIAEALSLFTAQLKSQA